MVKPHAMLIPYIAQGHVIPLMELAQRLVKHGVKVTFVNTEVNHKLVTKTWSERDCYGDMMEMVSIPDGMEPWEDRNDFIKTAVAINQVMPAKLQELIESINERDFDQKVNCVIADECMSWAIQVAEKMGIRGVTFWTAPAATLATMLSIQKLIDDRIIDDTGAILNDGIFRLSPAMPAMKASEFAWALMGTLETTKILFKLTIKAAEAAKGARWKLCNSTNELESPTFSSFSDLVPIGPLIASHRLAKQAGHFWEEDMSCLKWLDQQPIGSVVYVAFGSFTILNKTQFQELALGLELTNRPFLWVVRPGLTIETAETYPDGFMERTSRRGRIVRWAPQQEVLAHPSVACFLSHCGWNSTLEGVSHGIPFLSWPYFADQMVNKTYICDVWMNGLGFHKDENGVIRRGEIKDKVEQLLTDKKFKTRAMELKEKVLSSIRNGGSSHDNFEKFIAWIKEEM